MKQVYESKYTDRKITAAQKMAEIMCENLARKEHVALPPKFWNTSKWEKHFKSQVLSANSLMKLYSVEAIFRALRDKRAERTYSLNAPFLDDVLKGKQIEVEREAAALANAPVTPECKPTNEKPRPTFVQKKSVLRGLDDGEG